MRKVSYAVGVSLDGYIASEDGGVDWLNRATSNAKGEDFGMREFFARIDTVLIGRKTYEGALAMGADRSKSLYPGVKNCVFSRTLPAGERNGMEFISADPVEFVARLKQQPGKDIWLCGGGELAREFLRANAIDEIVLGVAPVLIGAGRPTFPAGFSEIGLELVESRQFEAGVVSLTYNVVRGTGSANSKQKAPRRRRA